MAAGISEATADQKIGGEVNRTRDFYVAAGVATAIIKHCQLDSDDERATTEAENGQVSLPPSEGGNIPANLAESKGPFNEKIPENLTAEGSIFPGILVSVPPQGLEPWTR